MKKLAFITAITAFLLLVSVAFALDVSYTVEVSGTDANQLPTTASQDVTHDCADSCTYSIPAFSLSEGTTIESYTISYPATDAFSVFFESTNQKTTTDSNDNIVVTVTQEQALTCTNKQCDPECVKCSDKNCHEPGFQCKEEIAIEKITPTSAQTGITQINILLRNKGTVDFKSITADISGDGITTIDATPIAKLVAGDKDYVFIKVNLSKPGTVDAIIKLTIDGEVKGKFIEQFVIVQPQQAQNEIKEQAYNVSLLSSSVNALREQYRSLEQEYQTKVSEGYQFSSTTQDKLRDAYSQITDAQTALVEGEFKRVQSGIVVASDTLKDIEAALQSAKKQEQSLGDKVKDRLLFLGGMAAAIVSIFTAYKVVSSSIDKEKISALHKKVLSSKKASSKAKYSKKETKVAKEPKAKKQMPDDVSP